jgi:K+-sensing histidine kinase KdpD
VAREAAALAVSLAIVAVVSASFVAWWRLTDPTIAALSFLLVVIVVAAESTVRVAIATSIAAAVCFNYFFLAPVGTFAIAAHQDWFAFLTLVAASVLVSRLSARARARTAEAISQGQELGRLLGVTRALLEERERAELVRQRAELKSFLLASLGHDLRTPLAAVTLAADNLNAPGVAGPERRAQVALIRRQIERLGRLFDNLTDMASVETQAVAVHRVWVEPRELVDVALSELRPLLEGRVVEVTCGGGDGLVCLDPRLTVKALTHVLENAARYSPAGSPIDVGVEVEAGCCRLIVRDRGPGIPPPDLERVFERCVRGRPAGPGTGMGLAIARGLLAAQAGSVRAANHPAGGAEFLISVPVEARPIPARLEEDA